MKKKRPSLTNAGIDGDVKVAANIDPPAIGPRAKPSKPRVEPIPRLRPASSGAAIGYGGGGEASALRDLMVAAAGREQA